LDTSGCTSVTAIITPKYIICANAGDSRCVLGTGGTARPMSEDHKPHSVEEKRRIESAGGFVQWNRVDGDLAVSRALGDFTYKHRPDLHPKDQKVFFFPALFLRLSV
jgi:serine/threonine protein phosphatase PrpC